LGYGILKGALLPPSLQPLPSKGLYELLF